LGASVVVGVVLSQPHPASNPRVKQPSAPAVKVLRELRCIVSEKI
jgi:hypothetical protein